MIVRIATEGQYELDDAELEALDALDNETVAACNAGNQERFHETFGRLINYVRENGHRVPEDELGPSDLILPPPDVSIEEAKADFNGEGLIPG